MSQPAESAQFLTIKEAIRRAREFVMDMYQDQNAYDYLLEGVELTDDEAYWLVTFSFIREREAYSAIEKLQSNIGTTRTIVEKFYRTIRVSASDGSVTWMRSEMND